MQSSAQRAVQDSYGRCLARKDFFDRFYIIFVDSHPDIRPMFAKTDMPKQKELLRHGLMSALLFMESDVMAKACIDRIRATHGATRLNIRPALYQYWIDSIVQTVSESDPQYSPALGEQWREVLVPAVRHIQSGYHG